MLRALASSLLLPPPPPLPCLSLSVLSYSSTAARPCSERLLPSHLLTGQIRHFPRKPRAEVVASLVFALPLLAAWSAAAAAAAAAAALGDGDNAVGDICQWSQCFLSFR